MPLLAPHSPRATGASMLLDEIAQTGAAADLDMQPVAMTFEARGDPLQAAILIAAIVLPFGYWWYITVPEARLALAKDKRLQDGETKVYLDELAASSEARPVERWFFSKWAAPKEAHSCCERCCHTSK